jgi:hypothetical protein
VGTLTNINGCVLNSFLLNGTCRVVTFDSGTFIIRYPDDLDLEREPELLEIIRCWLDVSPIYREAEHTLFVYREADCLQVERLADTLLITRYPCEVAHAPGT